MRKTTTRSLLMCGSTLLGLSLWVNAVKADTTTSPVIANRAVVTSSQSPTASQTAPVPVVTNHDQAAKPSQTTDWANPAAYQGKVPVQILGINDFHGGLEMGGKATIDGHTYQNTGTADRLAGYLNAAEADFKAANPTGTTIRVEAGDMVGASPANSALLQDESTKPWGFPSGP